MRRIPSPYIFQEEKMKTILRIASLILVAVMCFGMIACNNEPAQTGKPATEGSKPTASQTGVTGVTTEEVEELVLPEGAKYDGYEFRILGLSNGVYSSNDLIAEELSEDPINDAVYERNNAVKELLGIEITATNETAANIVTTIKNNVSAETDAYDLCVPTMTQAINLAKEGYLVNLYDVPYLALDKSWWDQNIPEQMTINGKLYFTTGDISYLDDDLTSIHIFNKDALEESMPDLDVYQMVKDKKWTWSALEEVIKTANNDLNGNGEMDKEDVWGMMLSANDITSYYQSAGELMVKPNESGNLAFAMDGTRAAEVVTKGLDFMLDNRFFRADQLGANADEQLNSFMEGRVLFRATICYVARQLRPMETDFGMLPQPLFDEEQTRYYTPVSYAMIGFCIPTTVTDVERTGVITEALAYYSQQYLTPAFYDITLNGLLARDDESKEMLDIIFGSKIYDIGYLCNFGGMQTVLRKLVEGENKGFASSFDSIRDMVNSDASALEDTFGIAD